jgi:hypothetical protein
MMIPIPPKLPVSQVEGVYQRIRARLPSREPRNIVAATSSRSSSGPEAILRSTVGRDEESYGVHPPAGRGGQAVGSDAALAIAASSHGPK